MFEVSKPNLSLYSPYYAEACNEFAVPNANLRDIAPMQLGYVCCIDVEAVVNRVERCVRFG